MTEVVERVKLERRLRGWSIREAATAGGVSNQTWGIYERTGVAGDAIQVGVMQAFNWPVNWQTDVPAAPALSENETEALRAEIRGLREQLTEVLEVLTDLAAELRPKDADASNQPPATPQRRRAASR